MPFNAMPGFAVGPERGVMTEVRTGLNVADTDTLCAVMVLGLFTFGKVPTAWSGNPLDAKFRLVAEHDQVAVAVAFTEGVLLKTLVL